MRASQESNGVSRAEDRVKRGVEALERVDRDGAKKILENLQDIAPDFARYIMESAYGEIWSRPGLDVKSREMVAVAALAAIGYAPSQPKLHIRGALKVECSRKEVVEILMQICLCAGFPAALNGLSAAKEVFRDLDKSQ